jgi:soluble lytic murein transglycosylase
MKYPLFSTVAGKIQRHGLIASFFTLTFLGNAYASSSTSGDSLLQDTLQSKEKGVQVPSTAVGLGEQRYHYNLAKAALNAKNTKKYQENYKLLGDYPLVPYLDYTALRSRLAEMPVEAVDAFLEEHAGSFLAVRLRQTWLAQLAVRNDWQAYIRYYEPEVATTELQCLYLYSRVKTGDESAWAEVADVWSVGESQPKQCDPLFNRWRSAGHLTQDLVWERFRKALNRRNLGLGRYLASLMDAEHQRVAQLYMKVDHQPTLLKQHNTFRKQDPLMQQVIAHGVARLAKSDAKSAWEHWELYEAQQLFPEDLGRATKVTLVRYLTRQGHHVEAEQLLSSSASLRQSDVVEELIREALREMDWQAVDRRIQMLPAEEQTSDRWRYWRARALSEAQLAAEDFPEPAEVYEELSTKRSFYGFMAADIVGRDYALEDVPVEVQPEAMEAIASLPGMQRAKELWLTGNHSEAQAEWLFTTNSMTKDELVSAGQLARQWGWYNKGIHAMIAGDLWDHLSIRFPLAYQEEVTKIASEMKLDPTLIYAIARQESAFAEEARSPAGARGLMQLMPATAAQTAKRQGLPHSLKDLYNPEHNIMLGSSYFQTLLQRFNNNRILAAAAYNAGPHRVARWISEPDKERPFDVWIETIPYRETRGYVQNVLSFSVIYGYRMGHATHLVTAKEANDLL